MPTKDKQKNREYQAKWYSANKDTQIQRNSDRRKKLKDKLRQYKSSLKCEICGESHPSCIDFHHKDKEDKEIAIHEITKKSWKWDKIMNEISKCQVLCSNCHRKIHWETRGL